MLTSAGLRSAMKGSETSQNGIGRFFCEERVFVSKEREEWQEWEEWILFVTIFSKHKKTTHKYKQNKQNEPKTKQHKSTINI